MGTVVSYLVEIDGEVERAGERAGGRDSVAAAAKQIQRSIAELHRLAAMLTTWDPQSPISRYRRCEIAEAQLPGDVVAVLELCAIVKEMTKGWFDPWAMPGGVDPTGVAKGFIIERSLDVLVGGGGGPIRAALVNGGGDIATAGSLGGPAGSRVGIQHPWRRDALACVVELPPGGAVATSGRYERGEHLVNPFAGTSRSTRPRPSTVASVTVTGPSLAIADGIATALAVTQEDPYVILETVNERLLDSPAASGRGHGVGRNGYEAGRGHGVGRYGYEAYLIHDDGTEESTSGFPRVLHDAGVR
jgi:thiamine biosynthesis lipoprotein